LDWFYDLLATAVEGPAKAWSNPKADLEGMFFFSADHQLVKICQNFSNIEKPAMELEMLPGGNSARNW